MEVPRHWRMRKSRLGEKDLWEKVLWRYREFPELSLAVLSSSNLTDDKLRQMVEWRSEYLQDRNVR